jgi:arachidonate 15-lipoxygenase
MDRPTLPPHDPDPQSRREQIAARRSVRPYDYSNPDGVAALGGLASPMELAPEDMPSPEYMMAGMGTHMRIRQHFMSLSLAGHYRESELIAPVAPLAPPKPLPAPPNTINDVTAATPMAPAASLSAYAALVAGLEPIPLLERLHQAPAERDALFAYQRIAGPNPYILQQVRGASLPDHFPVTEAHFSRALAALSPSAAGDDSLARALSEGRLFLVDCALLDGVVAERFAGRQKYLAAAMGLFVRPLEGAAALLPVAIQCGQSPSEATPVFTPADGWRWRIAQAFLSAAEGGVHEAGEHLALTHLVCEAFALSARRNLAAAHPLAALLEPHFEGTHFINFSARHNLIAQEGTLDRMMAPDVTVVGTVARRVLESFRLDQADPRARLASRGLLDPSGLTASPFREDALPLWDALRQWVGDYLRVYYSSDAEVVDDVEAQAFVAELSAADGGRLRGVPEVRGLDGLAQLATVAIFTATVQHAAVNFPQYPFMGYVPNMPGALYTPPPTLTTPDTEASLLAALPPLDAAVLQMYSVWQLSAVRCNRLGDYPGLTDPKVADALAALRARLAEIEKDILARDAHRPLPYRYLLPSLVPASILI